MPDKILKSIKFRENGSLARPADASSEANKEVLDTSKIVVEGLNAIPDQAIESDGRYGEKKDKYQDRSVSAATVSTTAQSGTQIGAVPSIDEMIKQTEKAIVVELQKTETEMKQLLKNGKSSVYVINNKVKRIRFLHGLLAELRRAAKMAEDYVVGLWKQFVNKMN